MKPTREWQLCHISASGISGSMLRRVNSSGNNPLNGAGSGCAIGGRLSR
ncbi:hypothetical protein M4D81_25965 [Paenibacillus sp. p3-SID867]|nr:hypothetical protein [Paenibacillus sp. p3-SID867]MCT1402440.1 hypothetical protein [Paenibacillus sp. p3-SID867]